MPDRSSHSKRSNQRGATLLELLLVLGLILIITPFIFRKGIEKNNEIRNIAYARDMQVVGQAAQFYLENNFYDLASRNSYLLLQDNSPEIASYLPSTFALNSKDFNHIHISIIREVRDTKVYLSALLVGDTVQELPELRVKQIASLIGSEGGFTEGGRAVGVTGNFDVTLSDYGITAADFNIALIKSYTRQETPSFLEAPQAPDPMDDFLWRKNAALYGYESWRNQMETDLRMGRDDSDFQAIDRINLIEMVDADGKRTMTIDGEKGIDMSGLSITNAGNIFFKKPTNPDYVLQIEGATGNIYADHSLTPRTIRPESGTQELRRGGVITEDADNRTYRIAPDDVSVLYDLKVEEFGSATVAELLGDYHLRNVLTDAKPDQTDSFGKYISVDAPGFDATERGPLKNTRCPAGYAPAILVSPVATSNDSLQIITEGDTRFFVPRVKTIRGEEVSLHSTAKGEDRTKENSQNLSDAVPVYFDSTTEAATFIQLNAKAAGGFFIKTEVRNEMVVQPDATSRLETVGWKVYTNAEKTNINVYCKKSTE